MRIHEMKCHANFFERIVAGDMPFTVRENCREYELGDVLAMNEVTELEDIYTGRCCMVVVTSILQDPALCKEDHVILGFRPCTMKAYDPYTGDHCRSVYAVPMFEEI